LTRARRPLARPRAAMAAWLVVAAAAMAAGASAQTLPAMKFVTGPLISPTAAETSLGTGTTHTNSLAAIPALTGPAPEIVETARALKNDPDLMFEFVHNQIETEFAFGERKGPLGTLIDKSGTPFDQNALFAALLRQAGYAPQIQIGAYTLSQTNFTAWTGISDLGAACRLLSSGGIPAVFTPPAPTTCQTSGAFTSVTILNAWSQVTIGGTAYYYDPALKTYAGPAPFGLVAGSNFAPGQPATQAAAGMTSNFSPNGVPYIQGVNSAALDTYLQGVGATLLSGLKTQAPALDTDTVVGLTKIQPIYKPVGGWRITTNPGTTWLAAADVPDQMRARFQVAMSGAMDGINQQSLFSFPFFVDDIDGRRLGIAATYANPQTSYTQATESLVLDDVVVASATCMINQSTCLGGGEPGQLTLTATHPYPAGTFADETVVKPLTIIAVPVAIVSGWGRISPARLAKWSDEVAHDTPLPRGGTIPFLCEQGHAWCIEPYSQSSGDFTRQKLAASWLAQLTRMARLQAAIGAGSVEFHHSIGVVDWRAKMQGNQFPPPPPPTNPNFLGITDEFTDLNIDSVLSVTQHSSASTTVAALSRSIALAAATLEGSVLEQMEDLPDTASTASRFAWANAPDNEDPCFSSSHPRPFYNYTGTGSTQRAPLYQYEGSPGGCGAGPYDPAQVPANVIANTEAMIASYVAGWGSATQISGPAETFLGPGARFGPAHVSGVTPFNDPSSQRGGAIIATQFDGSGNVIQVAHVLANPSGVSKGGGGKQPQSFSEYDPAKAADALKDRFVDRSVVLGVDLKTGQVGYTTPTLLSVGTGSAPYRLDYGLSFKAAPRGCGGFGPCTGPVQGGWNQTWDVRFSNSGSGMEAMGQTSPFAAAGSFIAFMAMQDIFGQAGLADLNKDVFAALVADWWRSQMVANVGTINRGFTGAQYIRLVDQSWMAPVGSPGVLSQGGVRVKVRDQCQPQASIEYPYSTSRRWDHSGVSFSLHNAGGDVLSIAPWLWRYETDNQCAVAYGYQPTTWTWAQGPSLTFSYDYQQGVTAITSSLDSAGSRAMNFTGVINSQGALTARVTALGLAAGQTSASAISDAAGDTWNFAYTPIQARSATTRPVPYPQLFQVYEPVSSTQPALQYGYDTRGLVNSAQDATSLQWGTRGAFAWYLAAGGRGERDDPATGAYTVYYSTDGDAVRNIDEIAREVDSAWDGRHRVVSRTYPESDQDQFAYDANDNVTALTRIAKSGSGLANLLITASYDPTWKNKLAAIVDPMGNETDFFYHPAGDNGASLMSQAQRPAVNGTRPTFTFTYNAIGLLIKSVDPTGVTTGHDYDSLGNLISTTEGAAAVGTNPALNLTTIFTPDAFGNVTAITDPRGNATTTQFDFMRRKVGEQNRDGGSTALSLMGKAFIYDANGRLIEEQRAATIDGNGNPTSLQNWFTSYTPTGKVAETDDPLGNATRTTYDPMDRPVQVIDASGRVIARTWDLAGQETSEIHGQGSPQQVTWAAFTWGLDGEKTSVADANNKIVTLGYDGFNRLAVITFPNNKTETSQYDPDGDLTIWTNRGGFSVVRCYDVLNRKVSETGTTGAVNSGACPTGGTSNLASRNWDMPPRTFSYDLAGRLSGATVPNFPSTWAYDAAGRPTGRGASWPTAYQWDGAGNMTSVTYTDGTTFTYTYDAMNRTTDAWFGSGHLANLGYDALGRRTVLTFGDLSSQSWSYYGDDRVMSLAHSFPNTPDNVTFGYGYDPAGRETSRTSTNAAYLYTPPVKSTAYTTNTLNQYPSVAGYSYSWWPEGPLHQDDQRLARYDEVGKLVTVFPTVTPGVVDTNNWAVMGPDALGHIYFHERQKVAGTAFPFIYHSTDGLRPENVVDWQYQSSGGVLTLQGTRLYVLGPDPDERWLFVDINSGSYYPHTDREGSTIALSYAGAAAAKYSYGPYGESGDAIVDAGYGPSSYPFRYTGQRLYPGLKIYDYKARDYTPDLGRFLQPDPAGLDQGPNLYEYVGGNPIGAADPSGMCGTVSFPCGGSLDITGAIKASASQLDSSQRQQLPSAVPTSHPGSSEGGGNSANGQSSSATTSSLGKQAAKDAQSDDHSVRFAGVEGGGGVDIAGANGGGGIYVENGFPSSTVGTYATGGWIQSLGKNGSAAITLGRSDSIRAFAGNSMSVSGGVALVGGTFSANSHGTTRTISAGPQVPGISTGSTYTFVYPRATIPWWATLPLTVMDLVGRLDRLP